MPAKAGISGGWGAARLSRDPEIPATLSADWRELLRRMTARDPARRPTALEVALAARDIASSEQVPLEDVATAQLELEPEYAPTHVMDTPGAVATERLSPSASPVELTPRRRRWPVLVAVILAIVVIAGIGTAVASLGSGGAEQDPPEAVPTMPAIEGELGTHLDELFEAVTP